VQTADGVVGLCGYSGAGKSSLAYGFGLSAGLRVWSDDALVFSTSASGSHRCVQLPYSLNLRSPSIEFFAKDSAEEDDRSADSEDDLGAILVIERDDGLSDPVLQRLELVDALLAVLPHAYRFFVTDGREAAAIRTYTDLASQVPVFRLRFPHRFEQLESVFELLSQRWGNDVNAKQSP
jgi:hypothetical protein